MFIGAIVFFAVIGTVLITHLLHYGSQKNFPKLNKLPYKTPIGISLNFICSLLLTTSLFMLIHKPLMNTKLGSTNLIATFAQHPFESSQETIGYLPENAVAETGVVPSPLSTLHPYQQQIAQATTNVDGRSSSSSSSSPTPSPTPSTSPTPSPNPSSTPKPTNPPTTANEAISVNQQPNDGLDLASSTDVYVIKINGQVKGYTAAFLNSLTIHKDLLADTRVMITVDESQVTFFNLDTNEEITAEQVSPTNWQENYPRAPLADVVNEDWEITLQPTTQNTQPRL